MFKPNLIITWIKHCDYPIFRGFLMSHRDWFDKVIILFSEHNRFPYFDHFIHESLKDQNITWLDPVKVDWGTQDWRNVSTNELIKHCESEWICSIEQDWIVKDWSVLWDKISKASESADYMGWFQENNKYIHPSFWFIRKDLLEKTSKDFAAHERHDHFGWIYEDVKNLGGKVVTTQDLGFKDFEDCFHLGGVNGNYLEADKPEYVFHRPNIFKVYNHMSKRVNVKHSPEFDKMIMQVELRLKDIPYEKKWEKFFR